MRNYWQNIFAKITKPVLDGLNTEGFKEFYLKCITEYSPIIEETRNKDWSYIELFARTIVGCAPLCNSDNILFNNVLGAINNVFNPNHSNYIQWYQPSDRTNAHQSLVEAAYLCQAFIYCPKLWLKVNQKKILDMLIKVSDLEPCKNNWILFETIILLFLAKNKIKTKKYGNIQKNINNFEKWYRGDFWYSDGEKFTMNYYNSIVIYPMLYDIYILLDELRIIVSVKFSEIKNRINGHAKFLEKLIHPDGSFPIFGRSVAYRFALLNTLALAVYHNLIDNYGQVRNALTRVLQKFFEGNQNFNNNGFLILGVNGNQINSINNYTNTGSLYITCIPFMLLGLPEEHPFWSQPESKITYSVAWNGDSNLRTI